MQRVTELTGLFLLFFIGSCRFATAVQSTVNVLDNPIKPNVLVKHDGAFICETAPTLVVGKSILTAGSAAFARLQQHLQERFGMPVSQMPVSARLPAAPYILIGLTKDHPTLRKLVSDHKSRLPSGGMGPEGYILDVTPEHILIAASNAAGVFYGTENLLSLEANTVVKAMSVPACTVVDWPSVSWRGMHLLIGSRLELPALEKIITEYMPKYRLNQLILEINYHFQFKSHPEVTEGDALTREDCRRLKDLADKSFVRLIPMINCLGHQSWAEHTAQLLKAHPEFDETPDVPADNKGIYCRSWCPSNPDVTKLVCDLADELIEAFDAKAFHVGMDEVFLLGQCPRCKGKDNAKLFARAVNDLHAHLVGKRKIQMLMWGDRFLDGKATGYGEWEASVNGTAPAIDLVPKDIVLCDWHYETKYNGAPATFPSIAYFQSKGLRVWPSGWNSEENVRMLMACALQNRSARMVGYLATTWSGPNEIFNGLTGVTKPTEQNKEYIGLPSAIRTGAQLAWEGQAEKSVGSALSYFFATHF